MVFLSNSRPCGSPPVWQGRCCEIQQSKIFLRGEAHQSPLVGRHLFRSPLPFCGTLHPLWIGEQCHHLLQRDIKDFRQSRYPLQVRLGPSSLMKGIGGPVYVKASATACCVRPRSVLSLRRTSPGVLHCTERTSCYCEYISLLFIKGLADTVGSLPTLCLFDFRKKAADTTPAPSFP